MQTRTGACATRPRHRPEVVWPRKADLNTLSAASARNPPSTSGRHAIRLRAKMKLFVASKMPDPREPGYADALEHWIAHFVKQTTARRCVFTNLQAHAGTRRADGTVFHKLGRSRVLCRARARPARPCLRNSRIGRWTRCCRHDSFLAGRGRAGER